MAIEFISVYITPENKESLFKLVKDNERKKDSILVSYVPSTDTYIPYKSLLIDSETSNEELLVDSFDNLEEIKLLISLGLSRIEVFRILQGKPIA